MAEMHNPFANDIKFIFDECKRLWELGVNVYKELPIEERFFELPSPHGKGKMLCGREAAKRVSYLADEAGRRAKISNRVSHNTLKKNTEELLVQRFIVEGQELSRQKIDRFLSAVGRKAKKSCDDIVHLIPCTLMTNQEPEIISIGPIKFHSRASFRRLFLENVKSTQSDEYGRDLIAGAANFYRQFDWVAEVKVRDCDAITSKYIAERAALSALDCLHLIFGVKYSDKMSIGGTAGRVSRRSGLTIDHGGQIHASETVSWAGQVSFPDGWSKDLEHPNLVYLMSLSGLALEAAVDPDLKRPLSRRFLDAAQWFGEASRDERSATRVVKYVTALERMVMTDERDDIVSIVSDRVAALCYNKEDASVRSKRRQETREIYKLRSRLVHGSMSPSEPSISKEAAVAAQLCEETLLRALDALGEEGLKKEVISTKKLANWYRTISEWVNEIEIKNNRN